MAMRRNGSSCLAFEKALFVFGGNEQDIGSLDSIEKYVIETDKWTIVRQSSLVKLAKEIIPPVSEQEAQSIYSQIFSEELRQRIEKVNDQII